MSAETFLQRLQDENLISDGVLAKLREQIGQAGAPVPAEQVAQVLIDKGHLTKFQANKLLDELKSEAVSKAGGGPPPPPDRSKKGQAPPPPPADRKKKDASAKDAAKDAAKPAQAKEPSPKPEPANEPVPKPAPARAKAKPAPAKGNASLTPLTADDGLQSIDDAGLQPIPSDGLQPLGDDGGLQPLGGDPFASAMSMEGAAGQSAAQVRAAEEKKAGFRGKKFRKNQWDSPWLLIGGGLLILFMLLSGVLVFVLTKGDAAQLFAAADKSYRQESYSDAIDKYETFLLKFPDDENAPKARVYRGLARLWLPVSSQDWERALAAANEELPSIQGDLADVPEARVQLSSLLTMIAQGIVADAIDIVRTDTDAAKQQLELLDSETNKGDAMDLVGNPSYVPTSEREKPVIKDRIVRIEEDAERVRYEINKEEKLVATVARMTEAADADKTSEAFAMRLLLMQTYGEGVGNDQRMLKTVKYVADKERELVRASQKRLAPAAPPTYEDVAARILLASRVGSEVPGLESGTAVFLARGSVYALDPGSGKVLWRRFVGQETVIQPQRMSPDNEGDVLLVDGRDNSLMRVDASTGELKWRLQIGRTFATPVITEQRILVSDESGRMIEVDPETGISDQHVQFPQGLFAGPGVNASGTFIYQPGEHSNVYVIAASDMQCRDVLYLGHKPGSVTTAPAVAEGYVFVAVNSGANYCVLYILEAAERGVKLRVAQTVRLDGHVVVPLQLYGRRVVAVTNLGAVNVFEVIGEDEDEPIENIASIEKRWPNPVVGYPLASAGYLWVADRAFSIFQLQTARGEISQLKVLNDQDTFLAPPQLFGDAVVHVRRRYGEVGATVSAVNGRSGEAIWRTDLAVPLAGEVVFDQPKAALSLVTAQASLFEIGLPSAMGSETSTQPKVIIDNSPIFQAGTNELGLDIRYGITLPDGRRTFTGPDGTYRLLHYDPQERDKKWLRFRNMSIPRRSLAAEPVAFAEGMLVPASDGRIYHLDAVTGKEMLLPYQPPVEPGKKTTWWRPTVLSSGKQFVAVDGQNRLHLVEAVSDAKPHLAGKHVDLPPGELRPPAVAGSRGFVFARGPKSDSIVSYQLPNLDDYKETVKNEERITWGPHSIGDAVIYTTDSNQMHCLAGDHTERWAVAFKHGFVGSKPLVDGNSFLVATIDGMIVKLNAGTGEEMAAVNVGEPLEKGPYLVNGRLVAAGPDGAVHILRPLP